VALHAHSDTFCSFVVNMLDEALLSFHMASFREATLALPVVRSTDR